jgi:hypothetical protein
MTGFVATRPAALLQPIRSSLLIPVTGKEVGMSPEPHYLNHLSRFGSTLVLPICLMLSACGGGGGGGVASIPPPPPTPAPTPTPAVTSIDVQTSWLSSPATNAGSYGVIGLVRETAGGTSTSHFAAPGEFQLNVSNSNASGGFLYSLGAPSGFLPAGSSNFNLPVGIASWDFNPGGPNYRYDNPYGDYPQHFGSNLKEYEIHSDGSKTLRENYDFNRSSHQNMITDLPSGQRITESSLFDIGLSYVAMGEWSWGPVTVNADGSSTPSGDRHSVYFAYGSRTPGPDIPTSGTATYDAHALSAMSSPFTLTADFGARSISTEISQASLFDVSGSAPFSSNGSFDITLAGTAGSKAASGSMEGAFFGPNAELVGGVFSVGSQGTLLIQDAFVGQQTGP